MQRMTVLAFLLLSLTMPAATQDADPENRFYEAWHRQHAPGDLEGAMAIYEELLASTERDREIAARAHLELANCFRELGDHRRERHLLARFLQRFPHHPAAEQVVARLTDGPGLASAPLREDAELADLRAELERLVKEQAELLQRFTRDHPEIRQREAEAGRLRHRIEELQGRAELDPASFHGAWRLTLDRSGTGWRPEKLTGLLVLEQEHGDRWRGSIHIQEWDFKHDLLDITIDGHSIRFVSLYRPNGTTATYEGELQDGVIRGTQHFEHEGHQFATAFAAHPTEWSKGAHQEEARDEVREALARGELDRAAITAEELLRLHPEDAELRRLLDLTRQAHATRDQVHQLTQAGELEPAVKALQRLLQIAPESKELHQLAGELELRQLKAQLNELERTMQDARRRVEAAGSGWTPADRAYEEALLVSTNAREALAEGDLDRANQLMERATKLCHEAMQLAESED